MIVWIGLFVRASIPSARRLTRRLMALRDHCRRSLVSLITMGSSGIFADSFSVYLHSTEVVPDPLRIDSSGNLHMHYLSEGFCYLAQLFKIWIKCIVMIFLSKQCRWLGDEETFKKDIGRHEIKLWNGTRTECTEVARHSSGMTDRT